MKREGTLMELREGTEMKRLSGHQYCGDPDNCEHLRQQLACFLSETNYRELEKL